ncbi:hypothetical protein MG296_01860 [Flavobacteriaceae bacterium TK19130]|nr:hypothetical protein [Thermobacterium salinum]
MSKIIRNFNNANMLLTTKTISAMKTLSLSFILLVSTLMFCVSCSDCEEEMFVTEAEAFEAPTPQEFEQLQQASFESLTQQFVVNASEPFTIETENGVFINVAAQCLSFNGAPVEGDITFEVTEFFNRGEMLAANASTVGVDANGNLELLISGGMFYFEAFQDGNPLTLECETLLTVPADLTGGEDPEMTAFTGEENANGDVVWTPQNGEFFLGEDPVGNPAYITLFNSLGWFNCDRFANFPDPKTVIEVFLPQEFSQENSNVYLALQGEPNSLGYLYGEFPVGLAGYIIFISEEDGDFRYAIRELIIEENQQVIFTVQETELASPSAFRQLINELP